MADEDGRGGAPAGPSVLTAEFRRVLDGWDEPRGGAGAEADFAGPWQIRELEGGHGLFRGSEDPALGDAATGVFSDREVALLFAAALPGTGREPIFELGGERAAAGHPVCRGRQVAGHLAFFHPELVAAAQTAAWLARSPQALAALLVAGGPLAIERTARFLLQHYVARRSLYGSDE